MPLNADTQLGAFGPGADSTRSRAAYPPPGLAVNLFVFAVGVLEAWTGRFGGQTGRLGGWTGRLGARQISSQIAKRLERQKKYFCKRIFSRGFESQGIFYLLCLEYRPPKPQRQTKHHCNWARARAGASTRASKYMAVVFGV